MDKCPSLDEPVPEKTKAKPESVKDAIGDAKLAAVDMQKDPLTDTGDEKETPATAKSLPAGFTIAPQHSQAQSAAQ